MNGSSLKSETTSGLRWTAKRYFSKRSVSSWVVSRGRKRAMARDGDLPTIFNPKRVRTPSVIVTSEEVEPERSVGDGDRQRPNGPPTPTPLSPRAPLTPQVSVCSAPPLTTQPSLQQAYSESAASSQDEERQLRDKKCPRSCCSHFAKKVPT